MKKISLLLLAFLMAFPGSVFAESREHVKPGVKSEQARVLKSDKERDDVIIEKKNGEVWLIQHDGLCTSMTSDFPVDLLFDKKGKLAQFKVSYNEICNVRYSTLLSSEARLTGVTDSDTYLIRTHLAELVWKNKRYAIDFGEGCGAAIRDFINSRVYLKLKNSATLDGSTLILPSARGQCSITKATFKEDILVDPTLPPAVTGLRKEALVNEIYFYWDKAPESVKKPLYLISTSRFPIDPDTYQWKEMPNLKYTRENQINIKQLATGRTYFFYFSVMNEDGKVSPWTVLEATPVKGSGFKNNPDLDLLEIKLKETDTQFILSWEPKSNAKKYRLNFFINGRRKFQKDITETSYAIDKTPDMEGKYFRFTVDTLRLSRTGPVYSDGHAWGNLPSNL
jgi:hypothetical protein